MAGQLTFTYVTGMAVSVGMALMIASDGKAYPFDISSSTSYGKFIGIATTAAISGGIEIVAEVGEVAITGIGWTTNSTYYIGSNSLLTSTVPSSGIIKEIAVGVGTDTIIISPIFEIIF